MAFNTISALQDRLTAMLQSASWSALTTANAGWTTLATNSLENAYQFIVNTLAGRGYSAGQIADWDYGPAFELELATFFALRDGGALHNYDSRFIEMMDRRKELTGQDKTPMLVITNSGQPVRPLGDSTPIGFGYNDDTRGEFKRSVSAGGTVTRHKW